MVIRSLLLVFFCASLSTWAQTPSDSDELAIQRDALSETLENPLRAHLLKKGYTPRNAAIAADSLLDMYARCLANTPRAELDSDAEITTFRLGDEKVFAYKSPCLAEFINDVASIP